MQATASGSQGSAYDRKRKGHKSSNALSWRTVIVILAPAADSCVIAAGHNKRLLPAALTLLMGLGSARGSLRSLPLYSLRCSGILTRASASGWAAAEAQTR